MIAKAASGKRKCGCGCRQLATGGNGVTAWASHDCAIKIANKRQAKAVEAKAKAERAEDKARVIALKPLQYWLKRAEKAVNAFVRERDRDQPCISCGTADSPEWHSGHFIPATAHATRFDPACVHKQCAKCNVFLGGNLTNYEIRLRARIGDAEVERLKNSPRARKWTREECQAIEAEYRAKLKDLRRGD